MIVFSFWLFLRRIALTFGRSTYGRLKRAFSRQLHYPRGRYDDVRMNAKCAGLCESLLGEAGLLVVVDALTPRTTDSDNLLEERDERLCFKVNRSLDKKTCDDS